MTTTEHLERSRLEVGAPGAAHYEDEILAFSQGVVSATDRTAVLRKAAKTIARALDAPLHTISEVDQGRQLKRTVCGAHESTSSCSLDPRASADACALAGDFPITVDDLVAETRFHDEGLRGFGVLSGICIHLSCGNSADCCIGAYDTQRQAVSEEVVNLAKIIASVASSALGRIAAEERLDEVQSLASAMLDSSSSLVLVLDDQLRIVRMNAVCQRVVEFALDEIKGRAMSSVLVVAEEYEKIRALLRQAMNTVEPIEFESHILTKHGERRRIAWSLSVAQQGAGGERSVVMTGVCLDEAKAKTQRAFEGDDSTRHDADRFVDIDVKPIDRSPSSLAARSVEQAHRETGHPKADCLSIAPYSDGVAPRAEDFFDAPFREISAGGVTFQLSQKPDFENLVIALGNSAQPTLLTAQLVRVQSIVQSNKVVYLAGCRFTGRLNRQ